MNTPIDRTKAKRTGWYPWPTRPIRVGWYEMRGYCLDAGTPMFWNGVQFGYWMPSWTGKEQQWVHWADDQRDEWRGLARKP